MNFDWITLKPLSLQILKATAANFQEPVKADEIAAVLGLTATQVNAAVTRSLVRHGLMIRVHKLSPVLKKESTLITITDRGHKYLQWLNEQASEQA